MAKNNEPMEEYEIFPEDCRFELPSSEKTRFSVKVLNNDRQSSKNYAIIKKHAEKKIASLVKKYGRGFFFSIR